MIETNKLYLVYYKKNNKDKNIQVCGKYYYLESALKKLKAMQEKYPKYLVWLEEYN